MGKVPQKRYTMRLSIPTVSLEGKVCACALVSRHCFVGVHVIYRSRQALPKQCLTATKY